MRTKWEAIFLMAIAPAFSLYIFVLIPLTVRLMVNDKVRNPSEVTWTIGDDKIVIKSKVVEDSLEWSTFSKVKETDKFYMLYLYGIRKSANIILPKRAFESSEQETAFRGIIKSHIANALLKAK